MDGDRDLIEVAVTRDCGYARVFGKGSYRVSAALREFAGEMLRQKKHLVIDLLAASGMDSTFLGIIASIGCKYRRENTHKTILLNLSDEDFRLISTLGVSQIVEWHLEGDVPPEFAELGLATEALNVTESKEARTEMMIKAHERLSAISDLNARKFEDVLIYLRENLEKQHEQK